MLAQKLTDYINAAFTGIWIRTSEPDEAEREIHAFAKGRKDWRIAHWDFATGFVMGKSPPEEPSNPYFPLTKLGSLADKTKTTIALLHNYHRFLNDPGVMQSCFNRLMAGKYDRTFVVVLSPVVDIPIELRKVFVVIEHDLPDRKQLEEIAKSVHDDLKDVPDPVLDAAAGLTRYEAEGAFALSLARHAKLEAGEVWELKSQALEKSNLLTLHRGTERFKDLGGLESLKEFTLRSLLSKSTEARPRGVMLLGLPGTGKSAIAKALGNEAGRPTLLMDMGRLKGGIVGQSEQQIREALRIADAMAPCILFVDEIEKSLAGGTSGYSGDGGVSADQLGVLLSWLNDHTSDVFFIGTANRIEDIAERNPELVRAERFDGVFFFDLPGTDEKEMIWSIYKAKYKVSGEQPNDENWTGAEIRSCCRLAAMLNVSLDDAATNIIPVANTAASRIAALRAWAHNRCLSANEPGVFLTTTKQDHAAERPSRRVMAKG